MQREVDLNRIKDLEKRLDELERGETDKMREKDDEILRQSAKIGELQERIDDMKMNNTHFQQTKNIVDLSLIHI